MAVADTKVKIPETGTVVVNKPKRVRTGCLTCRERHLKCDEAQPECQNCRKSNRECKRGIRLNFIDIQVHMPPVMSSALEWRVDFHDESRDIASEYKGGLTRYAKIDPNNPFDRTTQYGFLSNALNPLPPPLPHPQLPSIHPILQEYADASQVGLSVDHSRALQAPLPPPSTESPYASQLLESTARQSFGPQEPPPLNGLPSRRQFLDSQEETLCMQVFVEEVGIWMDSMDSMKHFSRLLPYHALDHPMLLNAFLACGARHMALVNLAYPQEKALNYYDTATCSLLQCLQDPNRDTVICATTAVILNVYEVMSERPLQRMNHIAGARALIKECGWNARSKGVGAACFWLNVGLEVLSCLHFNWQIAWEPDDWGVDLNWQREVESGKEEIWCHRMLYLLGKVANFRAAVPRFKEPNAVAEQVRMDSQYQEWKRLKDWCDSWNELIPRTMQPMAYLSPYQTNSKSSFPEVWLIKRATIVARLFYHTAMVLLSEINPMESFQVDEMQDLRIMHSRTICGIVAHIKDRGIASVALRTLAIAAECLPTRREQEEILLIFDRIKKETGWRIGFISTELKEKWGWVPLSNASSVSGGGSNQRPGDGVPTLEPQSSTSAQILPSTLLPSNPNSSSSTPQLPINPYSSAQTSSNSSPLFGVAGGTTNGGGILSQTSRPRFTNPLLSTATDFSQPSHPYQSYYTPPNQTGQGSGLGPGLYSSNLHF